MPGTAVLALLPLVKGVLLVAPLFTHVQQLSPPGQLGGLSLNHLARLLDEGFFRGTFQGGEKALGMAVRSALQAYGASGESSCMLDIFKLLRDPALQVK